MSRSATIEELNLSVEKLMQIRTNLLSPLFAYIESRKSKLENPKPSFFSRLFFDSVIAKAKIRCANKVVEAIQAARTIEDQIKAVSDGIQDRDYARTRKYSTVDTYGAALAECQKILKPYKKLIGAKPVKNSTAVESVKPEPVNRLDFF